MTRRQIARLLCGLGIMLTVLLGSAAAATAAVPAHAAAPVAALPGGPLAAPVAPTPPKDPAKPVAPEGIVSVELGGGSSKPSNSIVILIGLTILSVAPALLLMCTSFTKIFVVLSITRNALGLTSVPPNQVLAGLALFLSLFVMGPVLSQINDTGVQPYLKGEKKQAQAFEDGVKPLRKFMLEHTRKEEIALFTKAAGKERPKTREDVDLTTLIPAFALSELRAAFIIGFVIFIPFLVIDMVVSASLMSMGMMMLPPVSVALPFKLLLFVMANGWGLIVTALVASYR
jgi:flagellar biosynthetic protein FliP